MLWILRGIFAPKLHSLNTITIDRKAILHNLSYLQSLHPSDQVIPVLKSNGYGHGLKQMCQILKDSELPMVAVDSFPEYQIVKKHMKQKILLLGETDVRNYKHFNRKRASFAVYNMSTLQGIIDYKKSARVHIFLNTWMNREGLQLHEMDEFLKLLQDAPWVTVEWVMSHFASADDVDPTVTHLQIENFKRMYEKIKEAGFDAQYRHISASAGALKVYDEFFNVQRVGLALYGYNPLREGDQYYAKWEVLQPALRICSSVVSLQDIGQWEGVGYNFTYEAPGDTRIATLPFGYFEGLPRVLLNNRQVKWKDVYLPVVGTISMNLCCANVAEYDVAIGDMVEIVSTTRASLNTISHMAKASGMISYELLVKLAPSVKRKLV